MPLKIKLLLVEDNPGDVRLIREMLAESKAVRFDLDYVGDLSSALKYLDENSVDLILLDLTLPDSQGLASLEKVLQKVPDAAVVVLSGLDDEDIALQAVHAGAQDYLIKGQVDYQLLIRALRYGLERHRSEQALRKAVHEAETERAKTEAVVASVGVGICIVDTDFRIVYQNEKSRELEGSRVGEFCYKYCSGEDGVCMGCPVAKSFKDGQIHKLRRCIHEKSDPLYLDILASPLVDAQGEITGGIKVVTDVTDQYQASEEMEKLSLQNQLLLNSAGEGIIGLDLEGKHTFVNPAAAKMLGYEPDELIGKFSHLLWHHTKKDGTPYPFEDCPVHGSFKDGKVRHADNEVFWRKNGSSFPVEYIATPIKAKDEVAGAVITFWDISERRKVEEILRESEERYRDLFENANDLIQSVTAEGRFQYVNRAWLETLGYKEEDLSSLAIHDIICPDDRDRCEVLFRSVMQGEDTGRVNVKFRTKDGHDIYVEGSVNAKIEDGRIVSSRGIFRDVTDRKKAAEEKEKMQAQLLHAQKMEAVGTLAGGVAHDFNNILTTIQGYTDLAMRATDKDAPLYTDLEAIKSSCSRAAGIVRQLLVFSRKKVTENNVIDINTSIINFTKMLERLLGENIKIVVNLAPDIKPILADFGNIEQVIMNLAVNSRDAMSGGGTLTITTENVEIDEAYCQRVRRARPGSHVCLSIADTGEGLEKEVLEHMFEPFFTTKDIGKGTGLGLAVVYGIVESHNGWLEVDSEPGKGAVFKIFLPPVTTDMQHINKQSQKPYENLQGHSERILLIEDEKDLRDLVVTALKKNGYTVYSASNGKEAYALFEKHHGEFDLIFSDVVLPDTIGVKIVENLLEKDPSLKIILSSGYTDDKAQRGIIEEQKHRFIEKPYSLPMLLALIKEVLRG